MERKLLPILRDVEARIVPIGTKTTIREGTFVTLTQALGGAYTVTYAGQMARIDSEDADALGFLPETLHFDRPDDGQINLDHVWETLSSVYDPEIPVSIVDLGLIYGVEIESQEVQVSMTLTSPACGMGPVLVQEVEERLKKYVPLVDAVTVNLVFDPPWSQDMMTEEAKLEVGLF